MSRLVVRIALVSVCAALAVSAYAQDTAARPKRADAVSGQQSVPTLSPMQATEYVGQTATVCGRVVLVQCPAPTSPLFLTFAAAEKERVSVRILPADRPKFEPRRRFVDRNVCATGRVERLLPPPSGVSESSYVIAVSAPDRLQLVGDAQAGSFDGDGKYDSCDTDVTPPRVVRNVPPQYPRAAMQAKLQGMVTLEGVVLVDGRVADVRLVKSLDSRLGLDDAAIDAFKGYRFTPAVRFGQPVPFIVMVELSFTIR